MSASSPKYSAVPLPPGDSSAVPVRTLLREAVAGDDRDRIAEGPLHEREHDGVALAWTELRVVDPGEHRECRSGLCFARGNGIHCFITFDYWPEDAARHGPVWDGVLDSLTLGVRVDDPTSGPRGA